MKIGLLRLSVSNGDWEGEEDGDEEGEEGEDEEDEDGVGDDCC